MQCYDKSGDTEDESLAYYYDENGIKADGSLETALALPTKATMATSDQLTFREMYIECMQRL